MAKGQGLRFARIEDMPPGMRDMTRRALEPSLPGKITAHESPKAKRAKYGNQITYVDGIRFDSKREARYYEQLKLRRAAGEVSYWLRQVPVHLPGGTRYILDFLVFFTDCRAPDYVDVKGRQTKEFKIKKREVEHHYPFKVVLA